VVCARLACKKLPECGFPHFSLHNVCQTPQIFSISLELTDTLAFIPYNSDMKPSNATTRLASRRTRQPNIPRLVAVFFVFAVVMNIVTGSKTGGDVVWAKNYSQGMAQAQREGKPVLLSLHAPGCGWCKKMDKETFRDKQVVEFARRFVCISLDYSTDGKIIDTYGAFEYPLTIILKPDGKEIARWTGYIPPDRFLAALKEVAKP